MTKDNKNFVKILHRSLNKLEIPHKSCWKDITDFKLRKDGHHSIYLNVYLTSSPFLKRRKNNYALTLTHR